MQHVKPSLFGPAVVFILPFVLYVAGSAMIARLHEAHYPWGYAGLVALVIFCFLALKSYSAKAALRPHRHVALGVVVGVVGIALWIALSHLALERYLAAYLPAWLVPAQRAGFNPLDQLTGTAAQAAFLTVRILGIAAVVPVIEELFWRGFLLRWMIDPEWQRVPLGSYSLNSCLIVVVLFTLAHPEWLAAALYCLLLNGLLYWRKDLWQCVVAHATSNLLLAIYVLATGNWWLW
jgi:hypothetical protein